MAKSIVAGGALLLALGLPARAQLMAQNDINQMSIEQLANVPVTSVSKSVQPLSGAPAAVYVNTHDDIVRSGATSLAEILRLAPNLQVAQISANSYAITARGFNGNAADKLLVLIDGRSVYTPLFGGVLWDEKDVLPENIDRIEVISGPAGTLWGANAVNGVINIITRNASDTTGGLAIAGGGNREGRTALQYGGSLGGDFAYRVYAQSFSIAHDRSSTGALAEDGWSNNQGGFRLDWTPGDDRVTFQGAIYGGAEDAAPGLNTRIWGGNIQANWQHQLEDGSSLQLLSYYDATRRYTAGQGYSFDTYDLELQHGFSFSRHELVWGFGGRIYTDRFHFTGPVQFLPPDRTTDLGDIFAQDTISITPALKMVVGAKVEADPFSGPQILPNLRLSWNPDEATMFWAAVSRAVRAPTRFDVDLNDKLVPGALTITGDPNFLPETVQAYEVGTRMQPTASLSFSLSGYYNQYNDLRSVEVAQATSLPVLWRWGNLMKANSYGLEAWANYEPLDWWRLSVGGNLQHEDRLFKPASARLGGVATAGDDPNHQISLRSGMDLGSGFNWNADLRWIGMLPNPQVPAYVELNSRLGWNVSQAWELSIAGFNLLHGHHLEYELAGATTGNEADRSVYVEAKWRF